VDAKMDKIEYVGGQDTGILTFSNEMSMVPSGTPMWKMTGSGTYTVTFMVETTITGSDGKDTTEVETCTGTVTYPVIVYIYKDFSVVVPSK
jgi:hypothetical protein